MEAKEKEGGVKGGGDEVEKRGRWRSGWGGRSSTVERLLCKQDVVGSIPIVSRGERNGRGRKQGGRERKQEIDATTRWSNVPKSGRMGEWVVQGVLQESGDVYCPLTVHRAGDA